MESAVLTQDFEFVQATTEDIDGILDLQERKQPERSGTLSAPPEVLDGHACARY